MLGSIGVGYENNTAFGFNALGNSNGGEGAQPNTGNGNTAVGESALASNGGNDNTAIGLGALTNNGTGDIGNVAIGVSSLAGNTGVYNTAVGTLAMENNVGNLNTAVGFGALSESNSGTSNVGIGAVSLNNLNSGEYDICIGVACGSALSTESEDIDIGNIGVAGDSGVTRIGAPGIQTLAYIAGKDEEFTVSSLPACTSTNEGQTEIETDANTASDCVVGATPAGGGSTYCHVVCNSNLSAWVHF